jgi:sodium-dependent dicarboxylate transporter 2/3/5
VLTEGRIVAADEGARAPAEERAPDFQWPADRPGEPSAPAPSAVPAAQSRRLRWVIAGVGIALGVVVALMPAPAGLGARGQASFATFVISVTLWITNVVPIGVTGLLAVALLALLGGLPAAEAYAAFGNSAVFFILGVFIMAAAVIHSGLSKRLALLFLRRFQGGPYSLSAGVMITGAFMTVWMPAQATAAMLFPITLEIARAAKLREGSSNYGRVLFLSLAWGAMIGSNASMLGSARAPLALGLLEETFGTRITFAQWVGASAPMVLGGLVVGLIVLRFAFKPEAVDLTRARAAIAESVASLGRIGSRQWRVAAVMAATILCWIFLGGRVDRSAIAILGAVAMFALGVLRWPDLDGFVQWGIVLMYGGAIAVGVAIDRSGAATWLVANLVDGLRLSPLVALIGIAGLAVLLSEVMSNAAAVAVLLPLAFTLAAPFGISPTAMVFTACFGAGLAFTLPISSAPNTIAYSSGYIGMRDMLYAGSIMTVVQLGILLLTAWLYWPRIGIIG